MKIAIDVRVIEREMSGIGRYLLGFLEYILETDNKNEYFLFSYGKLLKFEKKGFKVIATKKSKIFPEKIYNIYWLMSIVPKLVKKHKIDIFFNPNHYLPLKNISAKKIITVHDLSHKQESSYKNFIYKIFYLNWLLPKSIKKADLILTVSENSKKDIIKYFNIDDKKIKVIYPAACKKFKPRDLNSEKFKIFTEKIKEKYNLPKKFILYVGRIENRKNIKSILRIARKIENSPKEGEIKFVLVGQSGYSGFKEIIKEINKSKNVIYIKQVEDNELPFFYNMSEALIYPSFYEGFGLGVLEAMQSGTPVLTSNNSSLPEVVGEGGIMHRVDEYEMFLKDIIRLTCNKNFHKKMSIAAQKQASKFSWKKSTEKLIKIFSVTAKDENE